jgi:hypothetical protein
MQPTTADRDDVETAFLSQYKRVADLKDAVIVAEDGPQRKGVLKDFLAALVSLACLTACLLVIIHRFIGFFEPDIRPNGPISCGWLRR